MDHRGMWADSTFEDLVQYNDGFRTRLIGTRSRSRNVLRRTGSRVLPLVREIERSEVDAGGPVAEPLLASL
jgi:dimethylsulfone monooxygenase